MRAHETEIRAKGATIAAVSLGEVNYARMFREETGIDFPLLIDDKRVAYAAAGLGVANVLHLLRSDNAKARKSAREGGYRQHKLGPNPFQLGGSFVFGPGNVDRFAHLSKTFGDNAPVEDLLKVI